jgi:hypothetical protein
LSLLLLLLKKQALSQAEKNVSHTTSRPSCSRDLDRLLLRVAAAACGDDGAGDDDDDEEEESS